MKLEIILDNQVIVIREIGFSETRAVKSGIINTEEAIKWIAETYPMGTCIKDRITNRSFCTFDAIPIIIKKSPILVDGEHYTIPYQKLLKAQPYRKVVCNIETNVYKASDLLEHKVNQMLAIAGKLYQHYTGNLYQSII